MVGEFPPRSADRLVRDGDWNHYYIVARGHRVEAWLNGVKTIDVEHEEGFPDGAIGLELSHGGRHSILEVKTLAVREAR